MSDLENEGQGHWIQQWQWCHLMVNINLYKVIIEHISLAVTVSEIVIFLNSWPWKCRSRSWCTTFAQTSIDGKCLISYLMGTIMFAFSAYTCQESPLKSLTLIFRSRSRSTTFAMVPVDGKYQPLKRHTLAFSIALTVFEIFPFTNSWPWKCRSTCTTFAVAPFVSNTRLPEMDLSLTIYEIWTNLMKWLHSYLRNEGQGQEGKTGLAPFVWKCSIPYGWFCS